MGVGLLMLRACGFCLGVGARGIYRILERSNLRTSNSLKSDGLIGRNVGSKYAEMAIYRIKEGAESNHRHADFQFALGVSRGLIIHHLQRLPAPTPGTLRHTYGTPNLRAAHSWHVD